MSFHKLLLLPLLQGCAHFPEFLEIFRERQILWKMCSVVFLPFTLKLPIQTLLSVAPKLPARAHSGKKCEHFSKTSTPQIILQAFVKLFLKILEDINPFCGATNNFGLLVMSAQSFKARLDPLACMLHHLCATGSSDSPLVQHLLTSWQPAWQSSCSNPHTCEQALVGFEFGIYHAAASQPETRQTLCQLGSMKSLLLCWSGLYIFLPRVTSVV